MTVSVVFLLLWQLLYPAPQVRIPGPGGSAAGGGGGPITLIDHDFGQSPTGTSAPAVTPSMNCTGANFVVAVVVSFAADASTATVTSSPSNTFSHGNNAVGTNSNTAIFYARNASVSSSMTVSAAGSYSSVFAKCFSNLATSGGIDQQSSSNGAFCNAGSCQPGSVTPSANDSLVITGLASNQAGFTMSINGSYTISDQAEIVGGIAEGGAGAYWIQTTATATNPTWSQTSGTDLAAVIAVFK